MCLSRDSEVGFRTVCRKVSRSNSFCQDSNHPDDRLKPEYSIAVFQVSVDFAEHIFSTN